MPNGILCSGQWAVGSAHLPPSFRSSVFPSFRLSVLLLSVCPPVRLSVCPSVRLSVCPPVRLSACPSVRLSFFLQVPLPDDTEVVPLVPGDDPGKRPHAYLPAARRAAPERGIGRQVGEERQRGPAHVAQLLGEVREGARPRPRLRHPGPLVEARERRLVPPRDPERAVGEDPLRVRHVAEDLLERPLPRSGGEIAARRP